MRNIIIEGLRKKDNSHNQMTKMSNMFWYLSRNIQIVGNSEPDVMMAEDRVSSIINADEETRSAIRAEQLRTAQDMNSTIYGSVCHLLISSLDRRGVVDSVWTAKPKRKQKTTM